MRHIGNTYKPDELDQKATYAKFAHMGSNAAQPSTLLDYIDKVYDIE